MPGLTQARQYRAPKPKRRVRAVNATLLDRDGSEVGRSIFLAGAVIVEHDGMIFEREEKTPVFNRVDEDRELTQLSIRAWHKNKVDLRQAWRASRLECLRAEGA